MPTTQKSQRTAQLAAIHVLKSKLGMSDEDYRAALVEVVGVPSAGALKTSRERQAVIEHFRRLERSMFGGPAPAPRAEPKRGWMEFRDDDARQVRKVLAMWLELGKAGKVERTTRPAVNRWVKRHFRLDLVDSLDGKELNKAIEMLKEWLDRD